MSDNVTKRMLAAYIKQAAITLFLQGLFQSPPRNFFSSEKVEIDIVRGDEDISIAVQDLSAGYRMNATDLYTNKEFTPPVHKEAVAINAVDLLKRVPGANPFDDNDFRGNLILRVFDAMNRMERKIRRAIELQAAQILQTGTVTLTDSTGAAVYAVDFKPKAAHFPTSNTTWGQNGATPLADVNALAEVVRNNGLLDADQLIFGAKAFDTFMADSTVQKKFDIRRVDQGTIAPMQMRGNGGQYRGVIEIGNYRYDVWTYGGRYTNPNGGAKTFYVDTGKVIVRASAGRLDAAFGAIPNIGQLVGARANIIPELPRRFANVEGGMDLFVNAWITEDGEQLFAGFGARPMLIPTDIDSFGCLNTGLT